MCAPCNIIQNTGIGLGKLSKKEKRIFYGQADRKGGAQCIRMGVMKDNFVFDRILHFS